MAIQIRSPLPSRGDRAVRRLHDSPKPHRTPNSRRDQASRTSPTSSRWPRTGHGRGGGSGSGSGSWSELTQSLDLSTRHARLDSIAPVMPRKNRLCLRAIFPSRLVQGCDRLLAPLGSPRQGLDSVRAVSGQFGGIPNYDGRLSLLRDNGWMYKFAAKHGFTC